jgi:DNA-binding MarR family transcriptional regulator
MKANKFKIQSNEPIQNGKTIISLFEFSEKKLPQFTEKKDSSKSWIKWGDDNNYPAYLLSLLDTSAYQGAIIQNKSKYVSGQGFTINTEGLNIEQVAILQHLVENANESESLNDILQKVAFDLEYIGGFAIEVIFTNQSKKIAELQYIDIATLRKDCFDDKIIYYSEDWAKPTQDDKTNFQILDLFDENNLTGKKIFYYMEPRKGAKYYPKPSYFSGIKSIATDAEITNYDYNNVVSQFVGGTLVNFANGEPTEEAKKEIKQAFEKKYTGTDNAGKVMFSFSNGKDTAPTVIQLNGNDLDKRFDLLDKKTQQKIFVAHGVTSPMLFGIKTEGQLGGRTEIREQSELFQNTYICDKQRNIEEVFNYLLSFNGFNKRLSIIKAEPISAALSENIIAPTMTTTEIREKSGLPAQPEQATPTQNKFNSHEHDSLLSTFLKFGRKKSETKIHFVQNEYYPTDSYNAFISEKDLLKQFAKIDLNLTEQKVLNLIESSPQLTTKQIASKLDLTSKEIESSIKKLSESKLISNNENKFEITEKGNNEIDNSASTKIEVLYSYEVRDGIGPEVIEGTRSFCRELLALDKLYTRAEIDLLSAETGIDVWTRRGGWYMDPTSKIAKPSCRHIWKQNVIRS